MKFYNVIENGLSCENDNNTPQLQELINKLNANGGGIIFFPSGVYRFKSSELLLNNGNMEVGVYLQNNISIIGESLSGTILKMVGGSFGGRGFSLFSYFDLKNPISGCKFENFTIDGFDCVVQRYKHHGKAFYFQNVKDCIFRDLKIIGTPATGLGIDFLDNVAIENIYCNECGRLWEYKTGPGGAGIGIGTGLTGNENFIIRNCITTNCGHFGIFIEDQSLFHIEDESIHPKGSIISNNICRNGRYAGIGVRGGKNILISNNLCYENHNAGIEVDYIATNCHINGNDIYDNKIGIRVCNESEGEKKNILITNNIILNNLLDMELCQENSIIIQGNITK